MEAGNEALYYWLGTIEGIGIKKASILLKKFQIQELYEADIEKLKKIHEIHVKDANHIVSEQNKKKSIQEWERLKEKNISYFSFFKDEYPIKLREIYQPPKHLFVKGSLPEPERISIGVVGARNCTCYGRDIAYLFGYRLAEAGIQVISGMAKGIDGWAHQGALESGNRTYAVLGSGVEICYPPMHKKLYESIQHHGGIISELNPYTMAQPNFFPMRNRIISGLSNGILVVEARGKSGSLITADAALEQGKDVFVIPGRIGDELSVGCNWLIRQGAIPVLSPDDILEHYGIHVLERGGNSPEEREILQVIGGKPIHLNEIASMLHMDETVVFKKTMRLKKAGKIKEVSRGYFVQL